MVFFVNCSDIYIQLDLKVFLLFIYYFFCWHDIKERLIPFVLLSAVT